MIDRRHVLTMGGLLGVLTPSASPDEGVAAGTGQMSDRNVSDLVNALTGISNAITRQQSFGEIATIRKSQTDFLHANGKFPDYIDVGVDVWLGIFDWHVRMQQPLQLARDANGRYTMGFCFTSLVLRQDSLPGYVGIAYDSR